MSENVSQNKVSILKPEDNYLMNFKLDESKVGKGFVMQSTKPFKDTKTENEATTENESICGMFRNGPN